MPLNTKEAMKPSKQCLEGVMGQIRANQLRMNLNKEFDLACITDTWMGEGNDVNLALISY